MFMARFKILNNMLGRTGAVDAGASVASFPAARAGFHNTAELPVKAVEILKSRGLTGEQVDAMGWYAHPKIGDPNVARGKKVLAEEGMVDAFALVEPMLGNRTLDGTLRQVDVLNGCAHHCDTCCVDAPFPSTMFTYDSLVRLFDDTRFIQMLQNSLRFGAVGDILNHPQGVEIVSIALESTRGTVDTVKIYTNYRRHTEDKIDALIELAGQNADRLKVIISLPLNRRDNVNFAFQEYVRNRPQYFDVSGLSTWEDGMYFFFGDGPRLDNIVVQDVRHPRLLFRTGRVLSDAALKGRVESHDFVDPETSGATHGQSSLVKTYLNPDALWLKIYATIANSHTTSTYTVLTADKLGVLTYLQWHPDFPIPPRWQGGGGVEERSYGRPRLTGTPKPVVVADKK
jgi:hypothetical protein